MDSPAGYNWFGPNYLDAAATRTGSEPNSGWSVVIDGDTIIMLPQGIWRWVVNATLPVGESYTVPIAPGGPHQPFTVLLDQVDYDPDFSFTPPPDGSAPWMYDAFFTGYSQGEPPFYGGNTGGLARYVETNGTIAQDKPDPQPFALMAYAENGNEDDVHLVQWSLAFWRLSP